MSGAPARVTLNIDLGELPDEPEALYTLATQVNVACGGHAGDVASMMKACRLARAHHVAVAAHPSYPDRAGFGRTTLAIAPAELRASLATQCRTLREAAHGEGTAVHLVKAHGALYHDVAVDDAAAEALVAAVHETLDTEGEIAFVGPPEGALARAVARHAQRRWGPILAEGFADRAYDGEGAAAKLRPRGQPGALLTDPAAAAAQALSLARTGRYGTICVHGDTPGALAIAQAVRAALEGEGLLR